MVMKPKKKPMRKMGGGMVNKMAMPKKMLGGGMAKKLLGGGMVNKMRGGGMARKK